MLARLARGPRLARHPPVRAVCSGLQRTLSPAEMDQAIQEMNDEMSELFGSPPSGAAPSSSSDFGGGMPQAAHSPSPTNTTALPAAPPHVEDTISSSAPASAAEVSHARAALLGQIASCTSELEAAGGADVSRVTSLAACIGECAKAVAALDAVRRGSPA